MLQDSDISRLLKQKAELLQVNNNLLETKITIQDKLFSLSKLQDTKPSSILTKLKEDVIKEDFNGHAYDSRIPGLLNSLAKIFAVSAPYVSIGLVEGKNEIYISTSKKNSNISLDINNIIFSAKKLLENQKNIALFYEVLYQQGNIFVKDIINAKNIKYVKKPSSYKKDCSLYQFAAQDIEIFNNYFNEEDRKNIQSIFNENPKFFQVIPNQDELHIHVELNLVAHIISKYKTAHNIHIGLASSNISDIPGCCGLCTASLNSVSEVTGIKIYRTQDFPQNMAKGYWDFPYRLLNSAKLSFKFFVNLFTQYESIIKDEKGNNEAYEKLSQEISIYRPLFEETDKLEAEINNNLLQIQNIDKELESQIIGVIPEQAAS